VRGNELSFFTNGRSGLDAMLEAIAAAKQSVWIETYTFRDDATGQRFAAALRERVAAGIEVRVLYDAIGSFETQPWAFTPIEALGGSVRVFNPASRPGLPLRRRDHRKILVVDTQVAFIGGLNIGDEYYEGSPGSDREWRDLHVRVRGPVARQLAHAFLDGWTRAGELRRQVERLPDGSTAEPGRSECGVILDGPYYPRRRMRDLLLQMIGRARAEVRLTSPYFFPGRRMLRALRGAARRGVAVHLLMAGHTDHPLLLRASRSTYPRLLRAGVQIYEYDRTMLHAKLSVFDGRHAILGTSNLDLQSLVHNLEVNLIIATPQDAQRLGEIHATDTAAARRVETASRGLTHYLDRAIGAVARRLL
jgi:cardiolipin synthase